MKSLAHFSCDLCAIRKKQCWSQNDTKPHKTGHLIIRLGKPVGGDEARCRLVFAGLLPRALVAQRIEQKTSRLQTPPPHRTTYKGSRGEVRGRAIGVRLPRAVFQLMRPPNGCPLVVAHERCSNHGKSVKEAPLSREKWTPWSSSTIKASPWAAIPRMFVNSCSRAT